MGVYEYITVLDSSRDINARLHVDGYRCGKGVVRQSRVIREGEDAMLLDVFVPPILWLMMCKGGKGGVKVW